MNKKWSSFAEQQLLTESFREWLREGDEEEEKWLDLITSEDNLEALADMSKKDREGVINNYLDRMLGDENLSPEERSRLLDAAEDAVENTDSDADPDAIKPEDIKVGAVFVTTNAKGEQRLIKIVDTGELTSKLDRSGGNRAGDKAEEEQVKVSLVDPDTCEALPQTYAVPVSKLSKSDSKCTKGEEGDQSESQVRTPLGKRIEKLLTGVDGPREYIDFLIIMKKIIENPKFIENARKLGRKAEYDQGDLLALKRLITAFEADEGGGGDEQ